jgi:DNA (cytosine-5)-methyltransferase 1
VLFADDPGEPPTTDFRGLANGFYWTEGVRGLGWAVDAVPTLKGGSTVGIPSPPAIWMPDGAIVTPSLRDAERLQGFPADWTAPASELEGRSNRGARWKMVGNAVSVPVFEWLASRLISQSSSTGTAEVRELRPGDPWPTAAWGTGGLVTGVEMSKWPVRRRREHLHGFLAYPPILLSARGTEGFLRRARSSRLRFPEGFLDDVARHLEAMRGVPAVA